jgi:hypothetical protein
MTANPTGWREMQRANPDYFGSGTQPTGYPEPVDVPPALRRKIDRASATTSSQQRACTFALRHAKDSGTVLIYGSIDPGGSGERRDHAWVELAGQITFDGATGDFYATGDYGPALEVVESQRYTGEEAARLLLETAHHGPWTATELAAAGIAPR